MVPDLFFDQLVLVALVWLCLLLQWAWSSDTVACPPLAPFPPLLKRTREPKPFAGLIHKPHCDACAHIPDPRPHTPVAPPPHLVPTRGRRRQVDTATHFCPNADCAYRGWVGWGNIRANGHPNGGPWRQLLCIACRRYFLESLGTIFHGKRASVEHIVRVIACLAEDFLPFVNLNLSNFTPSARPAHGGTGRYRSRRHHAASRSGYAATGPPHCVRLAHAAGLWPAALHTPR